MPFRMGRRFSGGFRRRSGLNIVDSIKNEVNAIAGISAATNQVTTLVNSVDSPATTNASQVKRGSKIFRIWFEFWYYGLSAGETNDIMDAYFMKNPGNNLTPPNPGTVGTSNEKKFIIKEWRGLAGLKSLGGQPYQWRGWIKIPKVYQRNGTDDRWLFVLRSPTTGNLCTKFVYKWFT